MHGRNFSLLPSLLLSLCASSFPQGNANAHSTLNGNWHLGGTGVKSIDFTFGVDGNTVYGEGNVNTSCTINGHQTSTGNGFFVEGPIASDGSFVLSNRYDILAPANVLTIRGRLPVPGGDQWSGSFAISAFTMMTRPDPAECQADSGDFTAKRLADIRGLYTGSFGLKDVGSYSRFIQDGGFEGDLYLEITQGGLTATRIPGMFGHVSAANAEMTLTGSSKFPAGDYSAGTDPDTDANSRVFDGTAFVLQFFHHEDGTELRVDGHVDKTDENRLRIEIQYVSKDKEGRLHAVSGFGWLTRQQR